MPNLMGAWTSFFSDGNYIYTQTTILSGYCKAIYLHLFYIGTNVYLGSETREDKDFLFDELTTEEIDYNQIYFYAGYKFMSIYDTVSPIQEVSVGVYALVCLDNYKITETVTDMNTSAEISSNIIGANEKVKLGGMITARYYLFAGEFGILNGSIFGSFTTQITFPFF